MKGLERFKSQVGGHIAESMGAVSAGGSGGPLPGVAPGVPTRYQGITRPKDVLTIPVAKLQPDPEQPRKEFDEEELNMLAQSLQERGQLQPIRVRWEESRGGWTIISGERRWRASQRAGLESLIAVEVKGEPSADDVLEDQIVENCVRTDLKPIEQAYAFKALIERRGYSGRQLAEVLSISHMSVQRALALLDLPTPVRAEVEAGRLAPATAYEVSKLDDPEMQAEVARAAVSEGLKRSEVSELVQAVKARRPSPLTRPQPVEIDLGDGISVAIRYRKASGIHPIQALRKAIKFLQEQSDEKAA